MGKKKVRLRTGGGSWDFAWGKKRATSHGKKRGDFACDFAFKFFVLRNWSLGLVGIEKYGIDFFVCHNFLEIIIYFLNGYELSKIGIDFFVSDNFLKIEIDFKKTEHIFQFKNFFCMNTTSQLLADNTFQIMISHVMSDFAWKKNLRLRFLIFCLKLIFGKFLMFSQLSIFLKSIFLFNIDFLRIRFFWKMIFKIGRLMEDEMDGESTIWILSFWRSKMEFENCNFWEWGYVS